VGQSLASFARLLVSRGFDFARSAAHGTSLVTKINQLSHVVPVPLFNFNPFMHDFAPKICYEFVTVKWFFGM